MNDPKALSRLLKVLAVEARVRIVQLLKGRRLCVKALASRLDVTSGAVSQHLRIMRDAGLVSDEKHGYFVHYRLNEDTLIAWRKAIDRLLDPAHGTGADTEEASECAGRKHQTAVKRGSLNGKSGDGSPERVCQCKDNPKTPYAKAGND